MKHCKKCYTSRDLSCFGKDKSRPDGQQPYCRDCVASYGKKYYQQNKAEVNARNAKNAPKYVEANKRKYARYKKLHSDKVNADNRMRNARKLKATPEWLTEEHKAAMQERYWLAKDLRAISGEEYHVDHIVPLKGEDVCGLHVPWNLQVLPAHINLAKSNSNWP